MPVPTWIEQQWIRITRILLGVCPPTRRGKGRHRGNQLSILQPSDWGHWHRTTIPSTIDASQLDVLAPFEAQGRGFEHGHGKGHGIVGTTSSTIDASQLDVPSAALGSPEQPKAAQSSAQSSQEQRRAAQSSQEQRWHRPSALRPEPHFICNGLVCMLCGEHQLDWGTPMQRLMCDGCYGKECGGLYCSCYDELEPKAATVSEVPEVQAHKPGSKLNAVPEAGPVKDAPTIDASQLDASRISDDHAHAPDHALGLIPVSQLTMPGCRWADVINR